MIFPPQDWEEAGIGDDDVVVPQQDKIAVYANTGGEVVIRQLFGDEDTIVVVARGHAQALADAILRTADRLAAELEGIEEEPPAPRQKPRAEYETKSASRTRPWEALGMSRATWFRKGKPETSATKRQHLSHLSHAVASAAERHDGTTIDLPFSPPVCPGDEEEEVSAS